MTHRPSIKGEKITMKEKRLVSMLLAISLSLTLASCSQDRPSSRGITEAPPARITAQAAAEQTLRPTEPETPLTRGTHLALTADAQLEITRTARVQAEPGQDGIWTVFVYLCGTDLESKCGNASRDLAEMVEATQATSELRFVVLAGGTETWYNSVCSDGAMTWLVIRNGEVEKLDEWEPKSMGDPDTLTSFLDWGLENYASQYMVLDLWDHGGGSVSGVCFDELFNGDHLTLSEIDFALNEVYEKYGFLFEVIGFDACLMATVEMANILVPYGKYMLASQESEPGTGWDYRSFGAAVAGGADSGAALGKAVCDGFYDSFDGMDCQSTVTLSVTDLSRVDALLRTFNTYCAGIYQDICQDSAQQNNELDAFLTNASGSARFGSSGGMVDLIDFAAQVDPSGADKVREQLDDCVAYMRNGAFKNNKAGGLSIYYPLDRTGEGSVRALKEICVTPFYLAIVDICAYACANMGDIGGYDTQQWLTEGSGYWSGENDGEGSYDYWNGEEDDSLNADVGHTALQFEEAPHLRQYEDNETLEWAGWFEEEFGSFPIDYVYTFVLTEEGMEKLRDVYYDLLFTYVDPDTGKEYYANMGRSRTYGHIEGTRRYTSITEDTWFGLPNGAVLCNYPIEKGTDEQLGDYVLYAAPILRNEEEATLLFIRVYEPNSLGRRTPKYYMIGTRASESAADGRIEPLKAGDEITPVYDAYEPETLEYAFQLVGETYEIPSDGIQSIKWNSFLPDGDYWYAFALVDIYGNEFYSDPVPLRKEHTGVDGDVKMYFVIPETTETLDAPTNITGYSPDDVTLGVIWDPVPGAEEYELCRFTNSGYRVINYMAERVTGEYIALPEMTEGTIGYFGIRAVKTVRGVDIYSDWTTFSYDLQ